MHVGVCRIRLRLPENHSLKGKRRVVKSVTSRVGNKFNVSIAEIEDHDLWQVAPIGISCISNDKRRVNEVLSNVIDFVSASATQADIELLDYKIEIIPVFDLD